VSLKVYLCEHFVMQVLDVEGIQWVSVVLLTVQTNRQFKWSQKMLQILVNF